jgi:large subunit ribosomal protein L23
MSNRTTKYQLKKSISAERAASIIQSPLVTEKSTAGSAQGKVSFRVSQDATKPEIKQAIEKVFGVKVTTVNTSILGGKAKRNRKGYIGTRSDVKKAIVTLAEGQTLDVAQA